VTREFRTSSRCSGGTCVEVAVAEGIVYLRASENPSRVLTFTKAEWADFVAGAKVGEFD
jgi:hypothetical protein